MGDNWGMDVTFILGPSGSGKTTLCLEQIRHELATHPDGPPLVFLAPKQSTFQIERQLLDSPFLEGFTRLQVLSFERLAQYILNHFGNPSPRLLTEEGKLMVLRSLILLHQKELRTFNRFHQFPGFVQELNALLTELQRQRIDPQTLESFVKANPHKSALLDKVHDTAFILSAYRNWLKREDIEDPNYLLALASEKLRENPSLFHVKGLWLDGFAEMSHQEIELLAQVVPCTEQVHLAFCLEAKPTSDLPWLSMWNIVNETCLTCLNRLGHLQDARITLNLLPRNRTMGRFAETPALAHLEEHWANPRPFLPEEESSGEPPTKLVSCVNPESEVIHAAREIRKAVRDQGLRYRDIAISIRGLEPYADLIPGVFSRFDIPFFMDARESIAHHPMVELTRNAFRLACYGWRNEDWFPILKTGLLPVSERSLDLLENKALEYGWKDRAWSVPFKNPGNDPGIDKANDVRTRIVPPFLKFTSALQGDSKQAAVINGSDLATHIRQLWETLQIRHQLQQASQKEVSLSPFLNPAVHETVWDEINQWLENVQLAFSGTSLGLFDWLSILDAGLDNLTVGIIPPSIDQVLVSVIDRSRQPQIRMSIVMGFNESIFPLPPSSHGLLSDHERNELENHNLFLAPSRLRKLGHERFFAYIALTRASERTLVSWSVSDMDGNPLNPSPFLHTLQSLFPLLPTHTFQQSTQTPEHRSELKTEWELDHSSAPRNPESDTALHPTLARALFGPDLKVAVSRMENYAACPFRFHTLSGLKTEERKILQLEHRERGQLYHAILETFHHHVKQDHLLWHDLDLQQASRYLDSAVDQVTQNFLDGFLTTSNRLKFEVNQVHRTLQHFIHATVRWLQQYAFEPVFSELSFGLEKGNLPAWTIQLDEGLSLSLTGIVDRLDLWQDKSSPLHFAVVIDYKSGGRKWNNTLVHHGVQLQLPAYSAAMEALSASEKWPNIGQIKPAGIFYVGLKVTRPSEANRTTVLSGSDDAIRSSFRHEGCYRSDLHDVFDARKDAQKGDQFHFAKTKSGFRKSPDGPMDPSHFDKMLEHVRGQLVQTGQGIFSGHAAISPCKLGSFTACTSCLLPDICRFDPSRQSFRILQEAVRPGVLKEKGNQ